MSFARPRREHHALPNLGRLSLSVDTALPDKKCEARPATSVASLASAGPSVAKKAGASTTSVPTPTETFLECTSSEQVLPSLVSAPTPTSVPPVENYEQEHYEETDKPFVPLQGWDERKSLQSLPDTFKTKRILGFKRDGRPMETTRHRHPTKEYLMVQWDGNKYVEQPCQIVGKHWEQVPDDERIERRYVADEGKPVPGRINHEPWNQRFNWFAYRINQNWLEGNGLFGDDPDVAETAARDMMERRKKPRAGVNERDKSLNISDKDLQNIVAQFRKDAALRQNKKARDMQVYLRYARDKKMELGGPEPTKEEMKTLAVTPLRTGEILPMYGWQYLMWHYDCEYDGSQRAENVAPNENNMIRKIRLKVTEYGVDDKPTEKNPIDPMRKQELCFVQRQSQRFEDAEGNGAGDSWAEVMDENLVPLNRYLLEDWQIYHNESAKKLKLDFWERKVSKASDSGQSEGSMDAMGRFVADYDVLLFNLGPNEAPKLFAGSGNSEKEGISPDYKQVDRRKIVVKTMRGGLGIEAARGGRGRPEMRRGNAKELVDEARARQSPSHALHDEKDDDERYLLLKAINTQRTVAEENEKKRITSLKKAGSDITDVEAAAMAEEKGLQVALDVASMKPETLNDLVWRQEGFKFDKTHEIYRPKGAQAAVGSTRIADDAGTEVTATIARNWPLLRPGDILGIDGTTLGDGYINENDLVVKFFPTCLKFAHNQDTPFMDGQLKGRDLDVRNRPYYAKDVSTPNPQQVPSVWKVADFKKGSKERVDDERKGMAHEWEQMRSRVSEYRAAADAYQTRLEAAYTESDKKFKEQQGNYKQTYTVPLASYTEWYNARDSYKDTDHKTIQLDLDWEDFEGPEPDYLRFEPLFGKVQYLETVEEGLDTVKILPPPANITDPGKPVWTLEKVVPGPPDDEPMVRGGKHTPGPGNVAGVTETTWMKMPLNVFEDKVFRSMWNHLTNVGMYTPEEKVDVPRHINAGYASGTGKGTGKKDEQNHAFCVGYAIYNRSTFERAMAEDRDYVDRERALRAARERAAETEREAQRARMTREQQMFERRQASLDREATNDAQVEKLVEKQDEASTAAAQGRAYVAEFRDYRELKVENLINLTRYQNQNLLEMLGPEDVRRDKIQEARKWPLLSENDARSVPRNGRHLMNDMTTEAWYEEWLDGTTELFPVPNPLLYKESHRTNDYDEDEDLLRGLNCPNGIRFETLVEYEKRKADYAKAEQDGNPLQPWFPERHEANYEIYAHFADVPDQKQCDTQLAGSRGYSQLNEMTPTIVGMTAWEKRLYIANKYKKATTELTWTVNGEEQLTERDHRLAYRQYVDKMLEVSEGDEAMIEQEEGRDGMETASVHSEHLERLHFHVLGDSHRASPSAARELASAVCGLTEREYKVLYDRLLPNEQRAMNLLRDQLV